MTSHFHLFVMDPVENLNLRLDSSLRMAAALCHIGHRCFITTPKLLSLYHGKKTSDTTASVRSLHVTSTDLHDLVIGEPELRPLRSFSAIHMRKDPPFDMAYLASTWLLEQARGHAKIYNDPEALRRWNEKLLIFEFPEYTNPGLISADANELLSFLKDHARGDAILKPLDLFGGRGVMRLNLEEQSESSIKEKLEKETDAGKNWRLIQPFDKSIYEGEVRVFTAGGVPIAWSLKVPPPGQYLANTGAGASVQPYTPSRPESAMVEAISKSLLTKGIFLTGFDIIGGKVSEINITSPRMLIAGQSESSFYHQFGELIARDLKR